MLCRYLKKSFHFKFTYCFSLAGSSRSLEMFLPGTSMAMWLNRLSGAAPRRCFTPSGKFAMKHYMETPPPLSRGGGFDIFPARRQFAGGGVMSDSMKYFPREREILNSFSPLGSAFAKMRFYPRSSPPPFSSGSYFSSVSGSCASVETDFSSISMGTGSVTLPISTPLML